ncbi:hypothetical protein XELAEV_18034843mg [Xenopus laevis]|uniref:Uncharacterized protein n=1 Tax=Xenopus laevis TaxID=8355 RepID=A0A974HBH6_XENLA|nr:hypothetical protein XELAEV_18034843mg [Xenopus laevis]
MWCFFLVFFRFRQQNVLKHYPFIKNVSYVLYICCFIMVYSDTLDVQVQLHTMCLFYFSIKKKKKKKY